MDKASEKSKSFVELTVLTWNISETVPSYSSPPGWSQDQNKEEIIKLIRSFKPNIFTLQEIPANEKDFGVYFPEYEYTTPFPTHSGYVQLFCNKEAGLRFSEQKRIGPTMLARIEYKKEGSSCNFNFAGAHLEPFRHSGEKRFSQIKNLCDALDLKEIFIFAGDMNMREEETQRVVKECLIDDGLIEAGADVKKNFTWDMENNKYFPPRPGDTFFQGRFDRIFLRNCKSLEFKLIANEPATENYSHYLSDHYGLFCRLLLEC